VVISCEHGNDPLSYMKGRQFFLTAEGLSASQEGICSTVLVPLASKYEM
jgi:hypothetical protein